jgi:hypothetical protein
VSGHAVPRHGSHAQRAESERIAPPRWQGLITVVVTALDLLPFVAVIALCAWARGRGWTA